MWSTLKTLQCSNTIVLELRFYQGLQIVLVSKPLWLLGLLQLLDAPEVTLTTSAFPGCCGRCPAWPQPPQAVPSEANDPPCQLVAAMGTGKGKASLTWTQTHRSLLFWGRMIPFTRAWLILSQTGTFLQYLLHACFLEGTCLCFGPLNPSCKPMT